jgi:riboflavin synthase
MFTGLVQHLGTVDAVEETAHGAALTVDTGGWGYAPEGGASVAVNGCCLTVTGVEGAAFRFDVVPQTLRVTTLGGLRAGDPVNLEHAVTAATLLGGHVVQGHVDGVGTITTVDRADGEWRVRVEPPEALMDFIVDRGSIAVDGVSLTLAAVGPSHFDVALIPETLERTTLGRAEPGGAVNIETDYLAKTVVHWLQRQRGSTGG